MQLAGMLPPDAKDARRVIEMMRELLENFMVPPPAEGPRNENVTPIKKIL